jgi:hypothetical protein
MSDRSERPEETTYLRVATADLPYLVANVARLQKLDTLILPSSGWFEIADELGRLPALRRITIPLRAGVVPQALSSLRQIEGLTLGVDTSGDQVAGRLSELPAWLKDMPRLTRLFIEDPSFDVLPELVFQLTMLDSLTISLGRIGRLPTHLPGPSSLRAMSLSFVQLPEIPREIGALAPLRELSLDHVNLAPLPAEVGDLASLEVLAVTYCGQPVIPETIAAARRLRSLSFANNPLSAVPRGLGELHELQFVDFSHCELKSIPVELWSIPKLKQIDLTGNPFSVEGYAELERAIAGRREVEVKLPRRAPKPRRSSRPSARPLAEKVLSELRRLGFHERAGAEVERVISVAGHEYHLPPALQTLFATFAYPHDVRALDLTEELSDTVVNVDERVLEPYECIHHHPYVAYGLSESSYVLIRLDDPRPDDPTLYGLDFGNYDEHEATPLGRLSEWLATAEPKSRG